MGRPPRAGDQDIEPAPLGLAAVAEETLRSPMRRDDLRLVCDPQLRQHLRRMPERLPVRPAPHDDPDPRGLGLVDRHASFAPLKWGSAPVEPPDPSPPVAPPRSSYLSLW